LDGGHLPREGGTQRDSQVIDQRLPILPRSASKTKSAEKKPLSPTSGEGADNRQRLGHFG